MKIIKLCGVILLAAPLLTACSGAPSESTVEELIEDQYEQANSMGESLANNTSGAAGDMMKNMMASMMPKLEDVDDINCDSTDEKNTYRCTAEITQSINGNTTTNKAAFKVYKVNDEWVLGQ
ncbi:hypothetical protein [Psychrobacter sp. I-STPA10]|uniref:hypothetical protein n=1 Tax=Psychrobacter sp. I-STPA10 TaxID=2585769 RepID=UPI001E499F92|nr:hypothetical protein [Psychrobacter sp. I-STPA10]